MVKRHNRRQANMLWQQRRYWTGVSCWWKRETLWWLISAGSCQNSNGRYLKVLIRRLYLCFHSSLFSLRDYWVAEDGAGEEEQRRGEHQISSSRAGCDHINYRSWEAAVTFIRHIFSIWRGWFIFFFKQGDRCQLGSGKKKRYGKLLKVVRRWHFEQAEVWSVYLWILAWG